MSVSYDDCAQVRKQNAGLVRHARISVRAYDGSMTDSTPYLRQWREFHGLSQDELADRLETSKGYYAQMERGDRPVGKWLPKIAKALGVEIVRLYSPPATATPAPTTRVIPDISAAQFRDLFVALVRSYGGDAAADALKKQDFALWLGELRAFLAAEDGDLTTLLSEWLLVSAAGSVDVGPDDPRFDLSRWRRLSRQTALLLADQSAPNGQHTSHHRKSR